MEYGIFSSVYGNEKIAQAARKIHNAGFTAVQFDPFLVEGKSLDPQTISENTLKRYRRAFEKEGIRIVSIGSYGRFISPDKEEARTVIENTKAWIRLAPALGTDLVVTEIGSKHPTHNWTDTPENATEETWKEIVDVYRELTAYAAEYKVNVGIEPHFAQPIKGREELRRILDDVGADNLKIIFDAANSVTEKNAGEQEREIEKFYEQLGDFIVLAHAKDAFIEDGETVFTNAGNGILPYRKYIQTLKEHNYQGPVILEWLDETKVFETLNYMKEQEMPPYLIPLFRGDQELFENAKTALDLVHAEEGALELKYRLLLSMVADALMRHPAGAVACAREALEAGATKDEVTEAVRVIYTAGGLPSLIENFDLYREVLL